MRRRGPLSEPVENFALGVAHGVACSKIHDERRQV
jgi:hypothetical protein